MYWRDYMRLYKQIGVCFIVIILLLLNTLFPYIAFASSSPLHKAVLHFSTQQSFIAPQPDKQSLLIVLLDRSGSLVDGASPTDPDDYSTSVTRALTDLWPGKMVVITFPQINPLVNNQAGLLGPYDLTDSTQRQTLKNKIVPADPQGDTPLGPAMEAALRILKAQPVPPGSQAVLITDGAPNMAGDPHGTLEANHIENDLLNQFSQLGVPIHTFGLRIVDANATHLLTTIAQKTGTSYVPVQSSTDLARQVMTLYAGWLGLDFKSATPNTDGNYAIPINELTDQAQIVVFRSKANYPIHITAPNRSLLTSGAGVQQSLDTHYQIDLLDVTPPVDSGTYTVSVGQDPEAQVYWIVSTRLHVAITAPTSASTVYAGHPLTITAVLLNGNKQFFPNPGAVIQATVTFTAPGQTSTTTEVNLIQQDGQDIFNSDSKHPLIYNTVGTLQIVVGANYEEIHPQNSSETLQIILPPCTTTACFVQQYLIQGSIATALLLIVAIGIIWYLVWRGQYPPTGYLVNARNQRHILELGTERRWSARLFKKSVITTQELSHHPEGALVINKLIDKPLAFISTKTGMVLRATQENVTDISVRNSKEEVKFNSQQKEIPLNSSSEILRDNIPEVTFQTVAPRKR